MESFDSTKKNLYEILKDTDKGKIQLADFQRGWVWDDEFNQILLSHVVNPDFMYKDDFYGFFNDRKEQILQRIEKAMGKIIPRDQAVLEEGVYVDNTIDEDDEM